MTDEVLKTVLYAAAFIKDHTRRQPHVLVLATLQELNTDFIATGGDTEKMFETLAQAIQNQEAILNLMDNQEEILID